MATSIEWTDETWNPVTGCTKISQGCKLCYAERIHERFNGKGTFKNVQCHSDRLDKPHRWKKPRMVFVNSMSDLFHDKVPFSFIEQVFDVMEACDRHTFQVLTKRTDRLVHFFIWKKRQDPAWKSPANVWIGVSVENQKTAKERLPKLNLIECAVKFVSCEPLIGPVSLNAALEDSFRFEEGGLKNCIDWVIVGGESGAKGRPMMSSWMMILKYETHVAGISFFFKQWGTWMPMVQIPKKGIPFSKCEMIDDRLGFPELMIKSSKKHTGNHFFGKQYLEFPQIQEREVIHGG